MDQPSDFLAFTTPLFLPSYILPKKYSTKIPIFPSEDMQWNFFSLAAFFNQLTAFYAVDHSFRSKQGTNDQKAKFHFKTRYEDEYLKDGEIFVTIEDYKIKVKATKSYIKTEWSLKSGKFPSNIGSQNKFKRTFANQDHIWYTKTFLLSESSRALYYHKSLLFFDSNNFSQIFLYFMNHFKKFEFCKINDKLNLECYYQINCKNETKNLHSFNDLAQNGLKGYIRLILEPNLIDKKTSNV